MRVKSLKQIYRVGCCLCAAVALVDGLALWGGTERGDMSSPGQSLSGEQYRTLSGQQYRIKIEVDYRSARFAGRQQVRFINSTGDDLESIFFNLYPNVGLREADPPWLTVQRVSDGVRDLRFGYKARHSVLKVALPYRLEPQQELELTLEFTAHLPLVQREETTLLAHVLQEVSDAVSDEKQVRDARDIFFAGEEAALLGYFYPLLAVQQSSADYHLAVGAGELVFSEVADYEVTVWTEADVEVIGPGLCSSRSLSAQRQERVFRGEKLRGFALALGERLKQVTTHVGNAQVISYFREGEDRLGRRVLEVAARAVEVFGSTFGRYSYPTLSVIGLPLPAGYTGISFPGMVVLARAYCIDFEAPQAARLPGIVREQAELVKAALEFTLAHGIAHQWWGEVVGSNPQRSPYLDEALASYSAAYFYEAAYGPVAGEAAIEQHLRAAYYAYRMFGGADIEVEKAAKSFRSALQYAAIVQAKGALFFVALRRSLGDRPFFTALRHYYQDYRFRIASPDDLQLVFRRQAVDPRAVRLLFQRWIKEKHGDEDIGVPDLTFFAPSGSKARAIGRFFVRIGRAAARPF